MRKLSLLLVFPVCMAAFACRGTAPPGAASLDQKAQAFAGPRPPARFQAGSSIAVADVQRIGMNLGLWSYWGAEQLSANVIKNPGFEGVIDRAIVVVKRAGADGFVDDAEWLRRKDGFWKGAKFDVRTGASAGRHGVLAGSGESASDHLPEYKTAEAAPPLGPGDIVAVTRVDDKEIPLQWWIPEGSKERVKAEAGDRRPGSPGLRSVALNSAPGRPVELISYLDTIGERAGKLLPVAGPWRFSCWVRSREGAGALTVEFRRTGARTFLSKTVTPGRQWRQVQFDFSGDDHGPAEPLELHLRASGDQGVVLLDDVTLGPVQSGRTAFREEVVRVLRELQPGYLRDWQGQLGDTIENRLAAPFARRASRYRPGDDESDYGYSLPEFLELCAQIGANPWIILPPTISDQEASTLGRYLAANCGREKFREVLLEFGNENWNSIFRPAGINDPAAHGQAAERAFHLLREAAGAKVQLRTVVNGQHANPEYAVRFARHAPSADILAIAPYFQYSLAAGTPQQDRLAGLFVDDGGKLSEAAREIKSLGKEISVYEVNLHTLEGKANGEDRDPVTAGAAAGAALARVMMEGLTHGAKRQCVYNLAEFDAHLAGGEGFARLFGVVRDLGPTLRLRPSGLAVAMINQAMAGDLMHTIRLDSAADREVSVYFFRSGSAWSAVAVSSSPIEREVTIEFESNASAQSPKRLLRLHADTPWSTNEERADVKISEQAIYLRDRTASFSMSPYGMAVLLSAEKKNGE
jgi:hypothetical protein